MQHAPYRLVTRSDFDGLVCGVLLKQKGIISEIDFAHPKDMQDGNIRLGPDVITTNLPHAENVFLSFDHHTSEEKRAEASKNKILDAKCQSAARVVYNYYGGKEAFPTVPESLLDAVDKCDAGNFSKQEALHPEGWILLNYLMDARTGLGRFKDFRISNYDLMLELVELCCEHNIEEILLQPDIQERISFFDECHEKHKEQILRCAEVDRNLLIIDLREEEKIWPGNRFLAYTLFPECNISMHILRGKENKNTVFAIGKSIFNKSSHTNVGDLCLAFHEGGHGGGHDAVGTCQIDHSMVKPVFTALCARIKMDG